MRIVAIALGGACALLLSLAGSGRSAHADDLPSYFKEIVGAETASPAEIGTKNILQLNTTMFELYADAGQVFRKNILAHHPLILGLFSGAGGRFILYRPGMAPIDAPSVPIVYQLLKSVAHSTMALGEVVVPYLNSPGDLTWRSSLAAYRDRMQFALDGLDATPMRDDWRPNNRNILQNNIAFMDECLKTNAISADALQEFAKKQSPLLKKNITWAAETQVAHWMEVIGGWKQMLGDEWDKTYAASNTIYVARQNNVLFSVLAQFFPPEAINDRLMLIETVSFTTTPEDMLELAHPNHRRPGRRRGVLRRLPSDGLRADGRRRASSHHRRRRQAQHCGEPAAAGAVRFAPMADADHAGTRRQEPGRPSMSLRPTVEGLTRRVRGQGFVAGLALLLAVPFTSATLAQDGIDPVTGFAREPVHVAAWPGGKKVAVSFALFVEEFGLGQGPVFRPDLAARNPDLVNEAFRQYGIDWGVARVGRLFKELGVPLSVVLNAEFPGAHPSVWKEFRAAQPKAPIIAHGMNNTSHMLPLGRGLPEQKAYIRQTLEMIEGATGVRPAGWSSPSVYSDGDTMQAIAAEGVAYTLDQMDSDIVSRLKTPDGWVALLPYPVVTVDMGQELARTKSPAEIEALWVDYVLELANEARADPSREATTVVIGIHPFVVGAPDGAAALRRVLARLKMDDAVWLADTDAILAAAVPQ